MNPTGIPMGREAYTEIYIRTLVDSLPDSERLNYLTRLLENAQSRQRKGLPSGIDSKSYVKIWGNVESILHVMIPEYSPHYQVEL